MTPFKKQMIAQLALSRAKFCWSLLGLSAEQLEMPIWEDWSARKLLAHIGRWDAFEADRLQALIDGRLSDVHNAQVDQLNARWAANDTDLSLDAVVAILQKERNGFLRVIINADDKLLRSTVTLPNGAEIFATKGINNSIEHDDDHAADIIQWRETQHINDHEAIGARPVLSAALRASRNAILAVSDLITNQDEPIVDTWSVNAIAAHLAGWESYLLTTLQTERAVSIGANAAEINARFVTETQNGLASYKKVRRQVITLAEQRDLSKMIAIADHHDRARTMYGWIAMYVEHDVEHADEMHGAWLRAKRTKN